MRKMRASTTGAFSGARWSRTGRW